MKIISFTKANTLFWLPGRRCNIQSAVVFNIIPRCWSHQHFIRYRTAGLYSWRIQASTYVAGGLKTSTSS
ncbi:hypothetical protein CS542_01395 [Pedobacter sp. IW39]|nr:hypothetical protein CS542_01395 [Pedobacter sp. IW39]